MQSKFSINSRWIHWMIVPAVFVVIPALFYLFVLRPSLLQILSFEQTVSVAATNQQMVHDKADQEVLGELASLTQFQNSILEKVPLVSDPENLAQYGAVLSGELTRQAKERGIEVLGVEMLNQLIKGQYVPEGNGPHTLLARWPRVSPGLLPDSMRIPKLDLPSLELQMRIRSLPSSRIFDFVESLARYSVLMDVSRVDLERNDEDVVFRLKMRSYYWMPASRQGLE
jgi:hypothetical protein